MPVFRTLLLSCIVLFHSFLPANALAEVSLGAGISVKNSPYKEYQTSWAPFPIISYEGEYAYIRGLSAGVKAVNLEFLEVSAYLAYDDTSFQGKNTSDWRLRRLDNRYSSVVGGLGARLTTPVGMLHLAAAGDLMNNSNGLTGEAGYIYSLDFGTFEFLPAAGFYWSNSKFNTYYYGVSGKESRESGLDEYSAGGSLSPYAGLTTNITLDEHWEIFLKGEAVLLGGQIQDSPMVNKTHTEEFSAGVTFTF